MKLIILEIIRQKKLALMLVLSLILINLSLIVVIASYQEPTLIVLRSKWSEMRNKVARANRVDAATLYRQGIADLEQLNIRIPRKREFARVLSDLFEIASDSGVATGAVSYRPLSIKDESMLSYQLSLSVSGDYAAVKSYLSDLLQKHELIVVDSVSLTNNDLFVENVVMSLNVTVYLREGA